jgi:hypothetical protein
MTTILHEPQEWDDERDGGGETFAQLKQEYAGPDVAAFGRELRRRLGATAQG